MARVNKKVLKITALAVFLLAAALLVYSLPGTPLVSETFPLAPTLLAPPVGGPP